MFGSKYKIKYRDFHDRFDLPLIGATLFLLSWGTVMIYSTGGIYADLQYNDGQYFLYRHLMHMLVGIYVVVKRGNLLSLGFTGMGFLTKSIGMMFLLYFGVVILDLNYKIYVPLLAFFWFFTHIVEAFVIQHYMKQNESSLIKNLQIK